MDCYVEFPTKAGAECALAWVNRGLDTLQTPKLGNRHVVVRASNQDELLKDLFPRANNVDWRDGIPHVRAGREKYCSGFQGFLTGEEIFCTVHHAEAPQRVYFTLIRCCRMPDADPPSAVTVPFLHKVLSAPVRKYDKYSVQGKSSPHDIWRLS